VIIYLLVAGDKGARMARLIELQDVEGDSTLKPVAVGDMLLFHASGGHVRSGADVVELIGPFVSAVSGAEGEILTPAGPPNTVLFRARRKGEAEIDILTGDPFFEPRKTCLRIQVEQ
jgi:hypothetical protein